MAETSEISFQCDYKNKQMLDTSQKSTRTKDTKQVSWDRNVSYQLQFPTKRIQLLKQQLRNTNGNLLGLWWFTSLNRLPDELLVLSKRPDSTFSVNENERDDGYDGQNLQKDK